MNMMCLEVDLFMMVMTRMVNAVAQLRQHFMYSDDYGMFLFCVADTEHDWREGSEQHAFIEKCLASADRKNQPWLIFAAHRVLSYSSDYYYALAGSFEEPEGRESLQKLWQKYKVDIAFYGHVHNYEPSCPVYEVQYFSFCILILSTRYSKTHGTHQNPANESLIFGLVTMCEL
ncbi:putative phosphodiesterase I [Helianthus annuus]|nr:putative phosphodiesterase I [Helianthus annuus]KAJ0640585.1 putative phosphodiesterase I [Helianthus annuus]KAJ0644514.1 putative phosphodiesterase I [Helianthus annuus]KAJ0835479.1 putative phosphodiesterase I [Helianthus annuus]